MPPARSAPEAGAPSGRSCCRSSLPGVIAGCTLTYAAAITAFITQSLIGGGQMLFMPMYLYQQASTLQNWPFAAAISIIFLLAVLAVVTVFSMLGRLSRGYGGA